MPDDLTIPYAVTFEEPQTYGAFAQVLHAAIDAGIPRAAVTGSGLDRHRFLSAPGRHVTI